MDQSEISRDMVMARYFELDSEITAIQARHKAELAPLVEEQGLCNAFVKTTMLAGNEQQVKITGVGQTYFTTKDSVTVDDMDSVIQYILAASPPPPPGALPSVDVRVNGPEAWEAILAYIQSTAMWGLLNNAANKTAVKEIIEKDMAPPPGVNYRAWRDLAWRRGKS